MSLETPSSYTTGDISQLELIHQGKVRDCFAIDDQHMLIVASDRLSAFDVVLPDPIPGKGELLTQISNFWFDRTNHIIPNHLVDRPLTEVLGDQALTDRLAKRSVVVKRLKGIPIEAIVRGYIIGSGWKDYQNTGTICGITMPEGLAQAEQLPEPIFTPSTKAAVGDHDENISFDTAVDLVGAELAEQVREVSIRIYREAAEYAASKGIIIADTKFEFGLDKDGRLYLMDEALTPDSSRFWPQESYRTGISPPSYDKQFVRDYLETLDWNKQPPAPSIPQDVIQATTEKYQEAYQRLTTR